MVFFFSLNSGPISETSQCNLENRIGKNNCSKMENDYLQMLI